MFNSYKSSLKSYSLKSLTNQGNYAIMLGLSLVPLIHNMPYLKEIIKKYVTWNQLTAKRTTVALFLFIFTFQLLVPQTSTQAFNKNINRITIPFVTSFDEMNTFVHKPLFPNSFPKSKIAPKWEITIPLSAYNSHPSQTDSTPCITANGYNLCEANQENVIAANFLPLGTKVRIPELFGDKEFTVVDRMNRRYWYKADIWMKNYSSAKNFGIRYATVEIY